MLLAVTVQDCWLTIIAGVVYRPVLLMVPEFSGTLQVATVFDEPVTVMVNGGVWNADKGHGDRADSDLDGGHADCPV